MKKLMLMVLFGCALFAHTDFLRNGILMQPIINRIPKIIHQVWVGNNPIPDEYKMHMRTWKLKHPDWAYKLWTDEDIEGFDWVNKEFFLEASNPGMKSDIWRYEIVNKFGGVYVDCDMECIRPLDPIHERLEFYTGFTGHKRLITNNFFASVPNSPYLTKLIEALKSDSKKICMATVDHDAIQRITGPFFYSYYLSDRITAEANLLVMIFPFQYFQPIECGFQGDPHSDKEREYLHYYCFTNHHNGLSWAKNGH